MSLPEYRVRPVKRWAQRRKFQLKHLPQYIIGGALNLLSHLLKLHPQALILVRKALEMGNPTETVWPSETIPMNSRLFAGGFWNYSFFQFHRQFYFPYWAHRQYNPSDKSFIPRSHNVLSINQTQRNWVSISFPGKTEEICVDMAGAVMPGIDRFTVEFASLENGHVSRPHDDTSEIEIKTLNSYTMQLEWRGRTLRIYAEQNGVSVKGEGSGNLIVSVRPFNMEGPALLHRLAYRESTRRLEGDARIRFAGDPAAWHLSDIDNGDALVQLPDYLKKKKPGSSGRNHSFYRIRKKRRDYIRNSARDRIGLVTAALLFNDVNEIDFFIEDVEKFRPPSGLVEGLTPVRRQYLPDEIYTAWFGGRLRLELPGIYGDWYNSSLNHLLTLWDYDSITPGSFTYHHFWIRDAVIMMNSLLLIGAFKAVRNIITAFPSMVNRKGLFKSQAGEWDSNGQALWIIGRYLEMTDDRSILKNLRKPVRKMLKWFEHNTRAYGVLPPGFSAEHLGVADWYLWDNFWALGGLNALARVTDEFKEIKPLKERITDGLNRYLEGYRFLPAALGREQDAGMIGSISASYPLMIEEFFEERMQNTLDIIKNKYFFKGGFFQENIHSGINPYLTMQMAGGYLYSGEPDTALHILKKLSRWAGKDYTFPEAVHPKTGGGCMGDGFHGWAFAEIISLMRQLFIIEYPDHTVLLPGISKSWLEKGVKAECVYTTSGMLNITVEDREVYINGFQKQVGSFYIVLPAGYKVKAVDGLDCFEKVTENSRKVRYASDRILYRLRNTRNGIRLKLKK